MDYRMISIRSFLICVFLVIVQACAEDSKIVRELQFSRTAPAWRSNTRVRQTNDQAYIVDDSEDPDSIETYVTRPQDNYPYKLIEELTKVSYDELKAQVLKNLAPKKKDRKSKRVGSLIRQVSAEVRVLNLPNNNDRESDIRFAREFVTRYLEKRKVLINTLRPVQINYDPEFYDDSDVEINVA